jgi:RNA-directed DNA polymerase
MGYCKQSKKIKTRFKILKHFEIDEDKASEFLNTRKDYWRICNNHILKRSLDNQTINNLHYIFSLIIISEYA